MDEDGQARSEREGGSPPGPRPGMKHRMGRQVVWVLVGLVLDCAALLAVAGALPPPGRPELSLGLNLVRSIAVGEALTLVHGVVLPVLVWPGHRLTWRSARWAVLSVGAAGPVLYVAFTAAAWIGVAVLWGGALAGLPGSITGPLAVWTGHVGAGAMAFAGMAVLRLVDGCTRLSHPAWGGAAAGAVLGGVAAVEFGHHQAVLNGVPPDLAMWPLPPGWAAWGILLLAGLPHLLLSARHVTLAIALLQVALQRTGVALMVAGVAGLMARTQG